jgi:hypothetical protein
MDFVKIGKTKTRNFGLETVADQMGGFCIPLPKTSRRFSGSN